MKTSKYFVVATLFATLSFVFLSCEDKKHTENGYEDVIWYNFDSSTKTASVTYRGDDVWDYEHEYTGEVVIPSTVMYEGEEYSVTSIGNDAFGYCNYLTSITLPSSVTRIEEGAFAVCSSLTSITIPEGVTSIGSAAFYECHSLKSITLPSSVTRIGEGAFWCCCSLTSMTCKNTTPPTCGYSFGYVDESIPVYVPKQSVEA
ncbi:MAG: leucine-rich repeat domain-containing protein, partial [Paludibacteraceae bacterium]|nr:leucine-rich repeat domain-containing protein [Paludibacteraceae bacterium]